MQSPQQQHCDDSRRSCMAILTVVGTAALLVVAASHHAAFQPDYIRRSAPIDRTHAFVSSRALSEALELISQSGFAVCQQSLPRSEPLRLSHVPWCSGSIASMEHRTNRTTTHQQYSIRHRILAVETSLPTDDTSSLHTSMEHVTWWTWALNALAVVLCVGIAALAAGLTLGLLGLDPLLVVIKERAAALESEQVAARRILPILSQRHLLLVTLLLMNAAANEALPLFLEQLQLPKAAAVLISVTLVLFFGEIIPSAVFTGPNQLLMASALIPFVKCVMWLLYPIAGPIAALLDRLLHQDDEADSDQNVHASSATYTRGELSALIRIQYEERLAIQQRKRRARRQAEPAGGRPVSSLNSDRVGALDFTTPLALANETQRPLIRSEPMQKSIRALKNQAERGGAPMLVSLPHGPALAPEPRSCVSTGHVVGREESRSLSSESMYYSVPDLPHNLDSDKRWNDHSIHPDEVTIVEGALQMQTKVSLDVFTAMRKVFTIPSNMPLNERNMVAIYASGYSRIPVHEPGHKSRIVGILVTKLLIVVDPRDARPVSTLPLRRPRCVSPSMPLVNLLNMFQSSGYKNKGGHLALVCARPSTGEKAMATPGQTLPEAAGLMGIITLEDVLESLLQEQIFDEMDRLERKAHHLANAVLKQWRNYVRRKKAGLVIPQKSSTHPTPSLVPVVERALANARELGNNGHTMVFVEENLSGDDVLETTALLPTRPTRYM